MYILKDIFVTLKYQASIFAKCFIQKWRAQRSNVVWVNCRRDSTECDFASAGFEIFFFPRGCLWLTICDF